jgi:nicotinamidase-related amidase
MTLSVEPAAIADDPWTRPEWDRAALLTIDTQVDFVEGGASPIYGTAAVVPAVAGCNFPNCPRAAVIGAGERDFRVVVAADAISGVDERHLAEAARLGAGHAPARVIAGSISILSV